MIISRSARTGGHSGASTGPRGVAQCFHLTIYLESNLNSPIISRNVGVLGVERNVIELLYSLVERTLRGGHMHARLNTGDRWAICRSAKGVTLRGAPRPG